jgi:hypothetical protein
MCAPYSGREIHARSVVRRCALTTCPIWVSIVVMPSWRGRCRTGAAALLAFLSLADLTYGQQKTSTPTQPPTVTPGGLGTFTPIQTFTPFRTFTPIQSFTPIQTFTPIRSFTPIPTSTLHGVATKTPTRTSSVAPSHTPTPSPSPGVTGTAARNLTHTRTRTPTPVPAPSNTPIACVGDCNHDGHILVNELVVGVLIVLDEEPLAACPSFDANSDGVATIDEVIRAVNGALMGCVDGG